MLGLAVHVQVHDVGLSLEALSGGVGLSDLEMSVAGGSDSGLDLLGGLITGLLDVAHADGQGVQIGLGGLRSDRGFQSLAQLVLGDLGLVGQSGQALDGNSSAVDGDGAVLLAGGDQDVNHLVGDSQGSAVDLDAFEDVGLAAGGDQVIDLGGDRFQLSTQGGVFGLDLVGKHLDLFEIYEFGYIFVLLKKYSISGMPPELSIKIPPLQATVLWDCGAAYLPSSAPNTSFSAPVVSSVLAASTDSLPSLSTVRPSPTFTPPKRKGVAVGRV